MRVVDRKTFLDLPAGTLYCKGVRWAFDEICVKADTLGNDWVQLSLNGIEAHDSGELFYRYEEMLQAGTSYPINESYGRDGCFDDDALFLVFERADLRALKAMIEAAEKVSGEL